MNELRGLPGSDRVERGLRDLSQAQWTEDALLLMTASTTLRNLGLPIAADVEIPVDAEWQLYKELSKHEIDPYGTYNAMRSELVSFIRSLSSRQERLRLT